MIPHAQLLDYLAGKGIRFFSGVPCSYARAFLQGLAGDRRFRYVPAAREDMALGISSGSWLAGRPAGVIMQNSGLGHIVNSLTSFNLIYRIPCLVFVTWRGFRGKDAPEHMIMGRRTGSLLRCLGIPFRVLGEDWKSDIDWALLTMRRRRIPAVLIIRKDVIV